MQFKNPHIQHFANSTVAFLKDFREKKDTFILKGLCRAFATYIPKFFLIKTTLKQDLVNVNEIRLNGYKRLSNLSEKQINELIDYFLSSSSEYYNQKFKNINELKNFMYKNKIQRSQIVLATKKNNPISALVKTKEIFNTALSYLKSKPENLIYVSYIFALGKVESKALESKNALIFHRDVDHFKFLKFFYYLTDCPIGGGHHEYFTKTHRNIKFKVAPTKR